MLTSSLCLHFKTLKTASPVRAWPGIWPTFVSATRIGTRWVKFGFKGCPDVLGQLRDGRILGVEVKGPTGKLRPEQTVFLELIRAAGGVAFVARDCRDVFTNLESKELSND